MKLKIVYIAGPYSAKSAYEAGHDMFRVQQNIMNAMVLGLEVAHSGVAFPLIPHANTMFFTGAAREQIWIDGDLELLSRCDAVLFTHNWRQSKGAIGEHDFAIAHRIPCLYSIEDFYAWLSTVHSPAQSVPAHVRK